MQHFRESRPLLEESDTEDESEQQTQHVKPEQDLLLPDEEAQMHNAISLDEPEKRGSKSRTQVVLLVILTAFMAVGLGFAIGYSVVAARSGTKAVAIPHADVSKIQQCAISNLHQDLSFLDNAPPIEAAEFIHRRDRLAQALYDDGIDAFVLEPGYTFQYYGNVSQWDWEPWEPEERPFLMIVQPQVHHSGKVTAKTTYLAPHFEEDRVRMLNIPALSRLNIIIWEEHWNPYLTLHDALFPHKPHPTIMTDDELRDYIVRGLASTGMHTVGLTPNVSAVREQKSSAEISLLRAVNTGTVEAVRRMRPCLVPGLTENQVISILDNALLSLPGFSLFFNIVLFDENAALPHGGKATGNKTLTHDTVVLIDVGAHYRGYSSDICRSFLIPPIPPSPPSQKTKIRPHSPLPTPQSTELLRLKQEVFSTVLAAQSASIAQFRPGNSAASVDVAARNVIASKGWEKDFTHRVGHGIGIKAHESPYLNKGNTGTILRAGMAFTSEPGVYLTGKFGVRTEDIFVVTEEGREVECLSGRRARSLWEP